MRRSRILWTDFSGGDANFVTGCTPVSEGCRNCYAKRYCERFGYNFSHVTIHPNRLERLRTASFKRGKTPWRRDIIVNDKDGPHVHMAPSRPMCFVVDMGDLFHPGVPDEFILRAFRVMAHRVDVDWQVLTKRPGRINEVFSKHGLELHCPHIWMGISAEDQFTFDWRMKELKENWFGFKFASLEPLLEYIDIGTQVWSTHDLGWCIVGGESGPKHRPFDLDWAVRIHDFCWDNGIPFFGKQVSAARPGAPLLIRGRMVHEFPGETP